MKKTILLAVSMGVLIVLSAYVQSKSNKATIDYLPVFCTQNNPFLITSGLNLNCKVNTPDLFYNIGTRWASISLSDIRKVHTIYDIFHDDTEAHRKHYRNFRISVLHNDNDVRDVKTFAVGNDPDLTEAQLDIIKSLNYSDNIRFTAICVHENLNSGEMISDSLVQYLTVTPETEATYPGGYGSIIRYLKTEVEKETSNISKDSLQPGKMKFIVNSHGLLEGLELENSCGYPEIDNKMIDLMQHLPEKWSPARNGSGKEIDQILVLSFGREGC